MAAPEVAEVSFTTTALFCAAVVVMTGADATCVPVPETGVDPPPLPQPATRRMQAAAAETCRNFKIPFIKPILLKPFACFPDKKIEPQSRTPGSSSAAAQNVLEVRR